MMRQSIYANWTAEMLKSRIHDLRMMKDNRWNPEITAVKREIVGEIVKVQMDWMEEVQAQYPKTMKRWICTVDLLRSFARKERIWQS